MYTDSDLAFCNSYEDGTSANSEPRQAHKPAEVGHSKLWAQPWVMRAYVLLNRTGNGFHKNFCSVESVETSSSTNPSKQIKHLCYL